MAKKSEKVEVPNQPRPAEDIHEVIRRLSLRIEAQPDGMMELGEAIRCALEEFEALDRERAAAQKGNI